MADTTSEVSRILDAWNEGDTEALDRLMPLVTDELGHIARRYFKNERANHTLQPTAVVSELYMKLKGQRKVRWHGRAEFFGVAAQWIRRILVEHARKHRAVKRGHNILKVTFDEAAVPDERDVELIALDDALEALARLDPRQSRIVVKKIFGGLKFQEIAKEEDLSRTTVWREWSTALPWLRREMSRG